MKRRKSKEPNCIETVKEKHHTGQKDIGLQEYKKIRKRLVKFTNQNWRLFLQGLFRPPIQMRGSFLVQCPLNQNSTRSEASWLPFLAGWRAAKLRVLENYFPSQASRGFAVHLLRAHITVTHADCSFRVLSHILDISLRLVEWYCLYLVSSLHHVILNCVNAPRFLFGFNLLFQLFVAEALFEVSCIYICHICVWQDWYSTATIDILMIILSCFLEVMATMSSLDFTGLGP